MNEICKCGHPKNTHMPFDKPAFGITHICGVNLCNCEQFRPTKHAPDVVESAPLQALPTPEVAPVGGADTTPTTTQVM